MKIEIDNICKDIADYIENEKNGDYRVNVVNYEKMKSFIAEAEKLGFKVEMELEPKGMHAFIDLIAESGAINLKQEDKIKFLSELEKTDGLAFFVEEKDKVCISTKINNVYEHK